METKTYKAKAMIEGDAGRVVAQFATLNVIDLDGDVTLPGAFGSQEVRLAAWGHNWGTLPVGKGSIGESGDKAVFDGVFFLETEAGREHYLTVKALGDLQEWSYGFQVSESEAGQFEGREVRFLKQMTVTEVSPVMRGAGIDTQTLAIKGYGSLTFEAHSEQVLADLQGFADRAGALAALRAKEGRVLSTANMTRIMALMSRMREMADEMEEMMASAQPPKDGERLYLEYQRALAGIQGVLAA